MFHNDLVIRYDISKFYVIYYNYVCLYGTLIYVLILRIWNNYDKYKSYVVFPRIINLNLLLNSFTKGLVLKGNNKGPVMEWSRSK